MNKIKNEIKGINIQNICQHVETKFSLSSKLTLILAGNGTGKSIFTESLALKPDSEYSDIHKNLLKFWSNDSKHKSKISFEYIDTNKKKLINSLIINKSNSLTWTRNKKSFFKPEIAFFNEQSSRDGELRNNEGQELINLSSEINIADLGDSIIDGFNDLSQKIDDYKKQSNYNKNTDKQFRINKNVNFNLFLNFIKMPEDERLKFVEQSRNLEGITVLYYFNLMRFHLSLTTLASNQHQLLRRSYVFYEKSKIRLHRVERNLEQLNYNNNLNYFKDFDKTEFERIKSEVVEHDLSEEMLFNLSNNIENIFENKRNDYFSRRHFENNRISYYRLFNGLRHWFSLHEKNEEDLLYYSSSRFEYFDLDLEKLLLTIKEESGKYRNKADNYKKETQENINKMLDNTFLKNKIIINDDLYITSPNDQDIRLRASTAELKLIFFKNYLIEMLRSEKYVDLLILDDITSSMDYQFIDIIYSQINLFITEYRERKNINFKILFLTHSDSIFNYFLSKESLKYKYSENNEDMCHYHMFQDNDSKKVLTKKIEYKKIKNFNYKNILSLLEFVYNDSIPSKIKLTLIRKIMECLAIVMNGSNELATFLLKDDLNQKYYFNTTVGKIHISSYAYEMLNLESHFDIYDLQSIDLTIENKRIQLIKEFKDIFTKKLHFPDENWKRLTNKNADNKENYKTELSELKSIFQNNSLSEILVDYKFGKINSSELYKLYLKEQKSKKKV